MRLRKGTVLLVGAGLVALASVNLAAAVAAPSDMPPQRLAVDPFVAPPRPLVPPDGSGAASWTPEPPGSDDGSGEGPADEGVRAGADDAGGAGSSPATPSPGDRPDLATHEVGGVRRALPRTLDEWVASTAAATGIPARAVEAYGNATLAVGQEDPTCHLGWTTLAGIGGIESGHGTHGGAALGDDGRPTIPIVGPALDGRPGFAAIRATAESTAWHGDPVWDHAVGPMQFIPSTWHRWGADGDGDGVADPQDADDAALAAARYLCAGGRDLSTWDGWHAAVLSYNHSEEYAQKVLVVATGYGSAAG